MRITTITAGFTHTKNLGNYESLKVTAEITAEVLKKPVAEAFQELYEESRRQVRQGTAVALGKKAEVQEPKQEAPKKKEAPKKEEAPKKAVPAETKYYHNVETGEVKASKTAVKGAVEIDKETYEKLLQAQEEPAVEEPAAEEPAAEEPAVEEPEPESVYPGADEVLKVAKEAVQNKKVKAPEIKAFLDEVEAAKVSDLADTEAGLQFVQKFGGE